MAVAFAAAVFLLAGLVKGVVGMGLPTVAMGLLALRMPPAHAAALLLVPSFVTNVWQLFAGPAFGDLLKRLWSMMAGICIGTVAGAGLLAGDQSRWAIAALGLVLILYGALALLPIRLSIPRSRESWLSPLIGFTTGLMTGATGVFVIPAVPYLQALGFDKDDLVQALGLSFTVSTIALAVGLAGQHVLASGDILLSTLAIVPALVGMYLGQRMRAALRPDAFRRVFLVGLIGLGIYLALGTSM